MQNLEASEGFLSEFGTMVPVVKIGNNYIDFYAFPIETCEVRLS